MSDETLISDELAASGISLVGDPVRDASEENKFYVFVKITRNKFGFQRPTSFKLRRLSEGFERKALHVDFIVMEDERENIEASVKACLFRFYPKIVRNAFVAFDHKSATVWVEPKKALTREENELLTSKIKELLRFLNIPLEAVRFSSSENIPTRTACLNAIRLSSPLTQQELQMALTTRGFHIPNERWLSKMLDNLRKTGHILRQKNGQFVLTLSGLKAGGSLKNRRSPDISRALAIARRGP